MEETPVRSLGGEDPLEKGKATHSGILAWRIPWTVCDHGVAKSQTRLSYFHFSSLHAQNMSLCPLRKSPRPSLPDYSPVPGHILRNVSYLLGFPSTSPYPFLGSVSLSVVSNSLWPHGLQPIRLFYPWDSLGKNPEGGGHSLLQEIFLTQGLNLVYRIAGRFFAIWDITEAQNTRVGCHDFLQGTFLMETASPAFAWEVLVYFFFLKNHWHHLGSPSWRQGTEAVSQWGWD